METEDIASSQNRQQPSTSPFLDDTASRTAIPPSSLEDTAPRTAIRPPTRRQPSSPLPTQNKLGSGPKVLMIVLVFLLILAGLSAYFLKRPQPMISVTSDYHVGSLPAGATNTILHVSGQKFSADSPITFLLDGVLVPGNTSAHSDTNGNVRIALIVTDGWSIGKHALTASDASNASNQNNVVIVPQGQAHTPGPNGAPPDDMSFSLHTNIQVANAVTGLQVGVLTDTLTIMGHRDPLGGTVCQSTDNGQPQLQTGNTSSGVSYRETVTWSCSGSYKGGKLSYNETATSDKIDFSNGVSCIAHMPYVAEHLEGTFSDHTTMSGTFSGDSVTADCNQGLGTEHIAARKGIWTGQI